MLKNYFKTSWRNIIRNKTFSFINIFGLAVGLTCFLLIAAFMVDELRYDRYPLHASQIYRLGLRITQNGGVADYPDVDVAVGGGVKNAFPEVLAFARINGRNEILIRNGHTLFKEQNITFCDSNFHPLVGRG
jgi:putative ABC transport system permease protein